jgi:methionyl-tRNA formyltransferase
VLTRADRPAGRGQQLQASPVKRRAQALGLPVYQPRTLREPEPQQRIVAVGADAMVVAAYGLILPAPVLAAPRLGCINIHASLLPRWRGAAPIQRAIEAGDSRTGITIMQMDEGLDTGPMLLAGDLPIGEQESAGSLHDRLAELGARLIVEALDGLARGSLKQVAQPAQGVTYATKISKSETGLDWREPAQRLADRIRAFDPFPGAVARLDRSPEPLKVWRARAVAQGPGSTIAAAIPPAPAPAIPPATASATGPGGEPIPPGTVLRADPEGLEVACGQGVLSLLELQKPGGRRLGLAEFLRGFPISAGERFQLP